MEAIDDRGGLLNGVVGSEVKVRYQNPSLAQPYALTHKTLRNTASKALQLHKIRRHASSPA